jgi:hypothetical protein
VDSGDVPSFEHAKLMIGRICQARFFSFARQKHTPDLHPEY